MFTLHDHIHTCSPPQCPSVRVIVPVCENLIFNPHDVQFVHHRNTSALFSPSTVYKLCSSSILLTTYGSLRAPSYGLHVVHWRVPTEYLWRLQTTTWWITIELTKEYFSTLKDIQLLSTSSHCCAQLVSFWLRAMDSPWEPNCTQHDSTDRYAIGNRKWYDQCTQ